MKPGGKLVLLEHGRASWGFVNKILDNGAAQHKEKWGCWWNRDIAELVRQVRHGQPPPARVQAAEGSLQRADMGRGGRKREGSLPGKAARLLLLSPRPQPAAPGDFCSCLHCWRASIYCTHSWPPHQGPPGPPLDRGAAGRPAGGLHEPLALWHDLHHYCRACAAKGAELAGAQRLIAGYKQVAAQRAGWIWLARRGLARRPAALHALVPSLHCFSHHASAASFPTQMLCCISEVCNCLCAAITVCKPQPP